MSGGLNIRVHPSYEDMSLAAAAFVASKIKAKPDGLLCFPSGDTPTGMLKRLVSLGNSGELSFAHSHFVGLDEWVGMDKNDAGSCSHYVYQHLFNPLQIPPQHITFFDAKAPDLASECRRVDDFLAQDGPLDIVVVGVGVNGHIGLNEPGASPEWKCHVIELAASTKESAKKYFSDENVLTHGITLGLKHIMNARTVILIANGDKKSAVMQKIIEGEVTVEVPGSILQHHPDCHIFLDELAASKLTI